MAQFARPLLLSLAVLGGCAEPPPPAQTPAPAPPAASAASIDGFFQRFTDDWVRRNPNLAISTRYFEGEEQDRLSRQITPVSKAYELETIAIARRGLTELATFERGTLTLDQQLSADIMRWQLQNAVDGEPFLDYSFPLEQMNGVNVLLPNQLTVVQPVATARDAENYVARLGQFDERMAEAVEESARQAEAGVLPPSFIFTATIAQMQRFIAPPAAENPLVTTLREKMADVAELSGARRDELAAAAAAVVADEVYPAWRTAIAQLEAQMPRATADAGLGRFEGGAALYAQRLHNFTTTTLTAEEIHAIGLAEVARIEAEMERLFRSLGLAEGTITEREEQLSARLSYPNTDEGRREIMSDIDGILSDALARTADSFDVRPATPIVAQPYPQFRWDNAAASYTPPPSDRSRPGIFQMPLRPSQLTRFALRSLVYHETVPGHHFQIALAVENERLPAFRRVRALGGLSASSEGWALYAERFAAEDGWYEGDVAGQLGQLSDALFRARRLVADTGLHAMGWTREQAIDLGLEASEVERYVVYPGQACSYMIGQLRILELRERAKAALGEKFSIKEFHNVLLR
ncbi:MAG TPA: DUF885 domain-containing protein, partial [Gammaproteobacteria bacterium]|nr:DUF885 domain-containing protein [Gammaproteobacteria bacterium]